FILNRFPCPGHGEPKAPRRAGSAASRCTTIFRLSCEPDAASPSTITRVAHARGYQLAYHRTEQRIFRLVRRLSLAPHYAKGHGEMIDIARGKQQGKADAAKPGLMRAFPPFLGQGILRPPLGFDTAIPHQMACPVLG